MLNFFLKNTFVKSFLRYFTYKIQFFKRGRDYKHKKKIKQNRSSKYPVKSLEFSISKEKKIISNINKARNCLKIENAKLFTKFHKIQNIRNGIHNPDDDIQ